MSTRINLYPALFGEAPKTLLESADFTVSASLFPSGVLALEMRYDLNAWNSDVSAFYDVGQIKLNRKLYPGALAVGGPGNSYDLQGVGLGWRWRAPAGVSVQLQVATKVGSNPARSATGKDADGRSGRTRAWLQIASYF